VQSVVKQTGDDADERNRDQARQAGA
jgi:hypothetical protein